MNYEIKSFLIDVTVELPGQIGRDVRCPTGIPNISRGQSGRLPFPFTTTILRSDSVHECGGRLSKCKNSERVEKNETRTKYH